MTLSPEDREALLSECRLRHHGFNAHVEGNVNLVGLEDPERHRQHCIEMRDRWQRIIDWVEKNPVNERTWFDDLIFDRPYHRLLKKYHPTGTVPYTLPISTFLWLGLACLLGVLVAVAPSG